jgi:hypothetical protein
MVAQQAHDVPFGIHWRTWHSYPQEGQLVATRTRVSELTGAPGWPRGGWSRQPPGSIR